MLVDLILTVITIAEVLITTSLDIVTFAITLLQICSGIAQSLISTALVIVPHELMITLPFALIFILILKYVPFIGK